jgi:hypothetical protein
MKKLIRAAVISFSCIVLFTSCDKNESCYDASLIHNGVCTQDCPGFLGCDGNTYCNECMAAQEGIGPN